MPAFTRYIGVDYSGAETPTASLKGLRIYWRIKLRSPSRLDHHPARANIGHGAESSNGLSKASQKAFRRSSASTTAFRSLCGISRHMPSRRILRVLLNFAVKEKLRRDNPALGIKLDPITTGGYHSWTEEELRQFETRHPTGTKPRLALALLLYTAQRRTDVVRLGPSHMREGRLVLRQSKTGVELDIPVAAPLADIIAATPMIGVKTFLVTEYGHPFTPAGFGNWFRNRCDEAGLPNCSAHGLRKAFLRRMAEAGCSEDYIASISGHKDLREIRTYVQAANKARMAQGMALTLARFPAKTEKGTP